VPQPEQALVRRISDAWRVAIERVTQRAAQTEILTEVASPYLFTAPVKDAALV
jgi:hypothetical protein